MSDATAPSPVFKRKKLLTRPVLKLDVGVVHYIKIESKVYIGKEIQSTRGRPAADSAGKAKEPAHIIDVLDLAHNYAPSQIIVNAVLLGVLKDNFADDSYVGRCFSVEKLAKRPGKEYFPFNVEEIEDPQGETTAPEAKPGVKPVEAAGETTAPEAKPGVKPVEAAPAAPVGRRGPTALR